MSFANLKNMLSRAHDHSRDHIDPELIPLAFDGDAINCDDLIDRTAESLHAAITHDRAIWRWVPQLKESGAAAKQEGGDETSH